MFDFLKKKDPLLFTMDVKLEPYDDNVMNIRTLKVDIKDGYAYIKGKRAGKICMWDYISQFGTPTEMVRTDFNRFKVDVRGTADRSLIFPDPHDKPYIYNCGIAAKCPPMMPGLEYICEMKYDHENKDKYDVYVAGKKVGTLKEKNGRVARLTRMLHTGYQATAQVEANLTKFTLYVIVRKV